MTWKERLIGMPLAAVGAVLLLVTAAGMALTRTDFGRAELRTLLLDKLNSTIAGRVEIDAFLGGDLLRRAHLAGVRIYEPSGELFASVDTVEVHYRWTDFLFRNIAFPRVTLVGPVVRLERADGRWNFAEAFAAATPSSDPTDVDGQPGGQRRIILREVAVRAGDLTLRLPWEPGAGEDAADSRWRLEKVGDRWLRVLRIEKLNATLPYARVAGPATLGRLLQIAHFTGRVAIFEDAIEVEQLRADIRQHGDTLYFDVWEGALPQSKVFGGGWVTLSSKIGYDFTLSGSPIDTRDLMWLLPRVPVGVARLEYRMASLRNGTLFEASNATWQSAEAEVSGRFAMQWTDSRYGVAFDSLNLTIDRLETSLIPVLTGWEPPVDGTLSGRVALDGPLARLDLDGELRFQPDGAGLPSSLSAVGSSLALGPDLGGEALEVEIDTLSLDLVRAFVPQMKVQGLILGTASLEGRLADGALLSFDMEQRRSGYASSSFRGGGAVQKLPESAAQLDIEVVAGPISLTTLAEYYPVIPFRGKYTGEIRAVGALDELRLDARFGGVGGGVGDSLLFNGNLRQGEGVIRYGGELRGRRARVVAFKEDIGDSNLDFRVEFEGQGTSLEDLDARARVELFASIVGGVRFDSAFVELRVNSQRLQLDTAVVLGELGELHASGALGLALDVVDSLSFRVEADSLSALKRWLSPTLDPFSTSTLATNGGAPSVNSGFANLRGSARLVGQLVGNLNSLALRGTVEGENVRYGKWFADSLRVDGFEAARLGDGSFGVRGEARATDAGFADVRFSTIVLTGELVDSLAAVDFKISSESGGSLSGRLLAELKEERRIFALERFAAHLEESTWRLQKPSRLHLENSGALALEELTIVSEDGLVSAGGTMGAPGPAAFLVAINGLELAELGSLWPGGQDLAGTLTLNAELSGSTEDPVVEGTIELAQGKLFEVSFSQLGGTLGYRDRRANVDLSMFRESGRLFRLHGSLPVHLRLPEFGASIPERPIQVTLDGDSIPLNLVAILTDQLEFSAGIADASIAIGGTPSDLKLLGEAVVSGGRVRVVPTGITYEDLSANAAFRGGMIVVNEVTLSGLNGGSGRITGTIGVTDWRNPEFDLRIEATALPAYDRLDARMVVSGTAGLRGPYELATLDGELNVVSGVLFIEEIGRRREIVDPFGERFFLLDTMFVVEEELGLASSNVFLDNLTIDQKINVEGDTWLRSKDTNVEIQGELTLRHRPAEEEFRIDGTLHALRGDYKLFNKRFALVEGEIEFVGTPALNPNIRLVARHRVQTQKRPFDIRVLVQGTLEVPTVKLESDVQPPIPESDLLSYLFFGRPTYEITRAGGEGGSVIDDVMPSVWEPFLGYALESLLVGETGIAYVDVSRAPVKGIQGSYASSTSPVLAATQVEVGWYLAPTVFVSVARHLSTLINLPTVNVEWRLTDKLTLQGIAEPRIARGTTIPAQNPGADLQESLGLLLFYGWSY
ncbi:MAG: translocation/assembly module TamB domain-containing protein [Gemmatimonadota bacterium]